MNVCALCKPDFEKFCVRVLGHILTTIRNTEINSWQFFFVMTGDGKPTLPRKAYFVNMNCITVVLSHLAVTENL